MRILVTNDDGVAAPGLKVAEEIAAEIAGPDGEVWTVAPAFEQSGVSHAISFTSPIQAEQLGPRRFAVSGTPADCVILAVHSFMTETPPDLVISGVNRGHNLAEDAVYSGTVGGAIEAALQGVKAIALSQYYRRPPVAPGDAAQAAPQNAPSDPEALAAAIFSAARAHGVATVRRLLDVAWDRDLFFNVNFPPVDAEDVRGARFAPQGRRSSGAFGADERASPAGRRYFWVRHRVDNRSAGPDADSTLAADGWITMVPMRPTYTAVDALAALSET